MRDSNGFYNNQPILNNHHTAVLIFANSASHEAELKPFKSSDNLFDALNQQTLKIVQKTQLPYFHLTEKDQVGNSFAERFSNAIQFVFDQGFENIISIGNDTPHLTTIHLETTLRKLKTNDIVLGPSEDGGFYLMGLKKSHFNYNTFLKLPWQTQRLFRSLGKLINDNNINALYLEVLSDIDHQSDLKSILDKKKILPLFIKKIILQIIKGVGSFKLEFLLNFNNQIFFKPFNKGSPILLHN